MKRIFTILFAAMLAGQTWATDYDFKIDNVCYSTWFGDAYVECENSSDDYANNYSGLTTVTIPDTIEYDGDKYPVIGISRSAFKNCSSLTSITLPNTIHNIREYAFEGCSSLESVVIPSSVTSLGENVFCNCTSLTSVTLPDTITYISAAAFGNCSSLTSIEIPNTVTFIGNSAFSGSGLTSIEIPNSVTEIASFAFKECDGLETITIPATVEKVQSWVFQGCDNLTVNCCATSIPAGWSTYWNDYNIPYNLGSCGEGRTWTVNLSANNSSYGSVSGGGTFADGSTITITATPALGYKFVKWSNNLTTATATITVSSNLTLVAEFAEENDKMWKITLSANSFEYGSVVRDGGITLADGSDAFTDGSIVNISAIPNSGYKFVKWSNGLTNANENITIISDTTIVAEFVEKGFVVGLLHYDFTSDTTVGVISSTDYKNIESVEIPETIEFDNKAYKVTSISKNAFDGCSSLKSVTLPRSVTIIEDYAFYKCEKLALITIPEQVTTIGAAAFYACGELTSITIPNSVSSIEGCPFNECDKLTEINVENDNLYFSSENGVLFNKDKTELLCYPGGKTGSYIIPNGVITIGWSAFNCCRGLTSVVIPNTVKSISDYAFDNSDITSIIIPNSVTVIENCAFRYCGYLTSIVIPNSVQTICEGTFYGCHSATIYCESEEKPTSWSDKWNYDWSDRIPVVWGVNMNTIFNVTVIANNDAYGDVKGGGIVIEDSIVTITATPAQGYHFTSWSDNNTNNPRTLTVTSDTSLTAFFEAHTVVSDSAVAATCTEKGKTEGSHCSVCGKVIVKQDTIPAKGHTIVVDKAVKPTCTETGLGEGKHCSVCNEILMTQELLLALGHEFVNYIYNNDATTTADGTETAVCEHGCGETDTRVKEGTKLATAVTESAANAVNIYAHGNTIVVENATEDIFVYNAMGALVCKEAIHRISTTITVNNSGVYIVKTGSTVKRVMVN